MKDYEGKTALVTGASSGIGLATAEELARWGAHVILVARREDRLEALAEKITAEGGKATSMPCDITDEQGVKDLFAKLRDNTDSLYLLVNNAGRALSLPLQVTKLDDIRSVMELNVIAMLSVIKSTLRLLKKGSAVVNISSVYGLQGAPVMSAYAASKAGVIALTRCLAREFAPRGIRVNAIAPGMVRTELLEESLGKLKPEQVEAMEARCPLGVGMPEDVAAAVAFLGSDDAKWITGHTMVVDGGLTA